MKRLTESTIAGLAFIFWLGCGGGGVAPALYADAGDASEGIGATRDKPMDPQSTETVLDGFEQPDSFDSGWGTGGPGMPGWECRDNTQCFSGYCIETPEGRFCTNRCSDENDCPPGYQCLQVATHPDVIYVCIHPAPNICKPCMSDDDCVADFVPTPMSCVWLHGYGFCLKRCDESSPCEEGVQCLSTRGISGEVQVCMPSQGQCECSQKFVSSGSVGVCEIENEFGRCQGSYSCKADGPSDCDGQKPSPEVCDGKDNDCDGMTDEDLTGSSCDLANSLGVCKGVTSCVDGKEMCIGSYPAPEVCNGKDENCDGETDEEGAVGCTNYFEDKDRDQFGSSSFKCLCAPQYPYTATQAGDCDDNDPLVKPSGYEVCGNNKDDNCDGVTDKGENAIGCKVFYMDGDGDGFGVAYSRCLCQPEPPFVANNALDCNDTIASINPDAKEACNGIDDNCNGMIDEEDALGCVSFYYDGDRDGYGTGTPKCLCNPQGYYSAINTGDCDDSKYSVNPGAQEVCNFLDDDCDGVIDNGVSSPCGGCQAVCTITAGANTGNPFAPTGENSSGVSADPSGFLVLDSTKIDFPFIWIANSGEGTVSKLNTRTGCEVARYNVCSDPSRTAVDLNGNGIITCRGDGKVAKVAIFEQDCIDKNGNGVIDTSRDTDGDCQIQASEMVTDDECVMWVVQPDGPPSTGCPSSGNGCARAAGVDKDNNIWVGFWNSSRLRKLRSSDGAVLQTFSVSRRPYGLGIDQQGTIWFVSRDPSPHSLVKVNPSSGEVGSWAVPGNYAYGMAIDPWGKVWVATGESMGLSRFDPVSNSWTNTWTWSDRGITRGVAISVLRDASGAVAGSKVYVAHHTWTCQLGRYISVVDAKTLTPETPIDLGNAVFGPVGVAIDFDGYLWSINQCTSNASKIDTQTKQVVGTYPVGKSPYTYSDMTGYALKTITAPQGYYRQVFEGWQTQQTQWNLIYVDADLPGDGKTYVKVRFRVADSIQGLKDQAWFGPYGPYPPAMFPLDLTTIANIVGRYLEVEVTLYTIDNNLVPRLKKVSVVASLR